MNERKELPYWIKSVWRMCNVRDDVYMYVNPYGTLTTSPHGHVIIDESKNPEHTSKYVYIEDNDLVFCYVCADKDGFFGVEEGRLRFNKYNELEGTVPECIDLYENGLEGSVDAVFCYMSRALASMPYYEELRFTNKITFNPDMSFNVLYLFINKADKMIPILLQEGFADVVEHVFINGYTIPIHKINRKVIRLAKNCGIGIKSAISLSRFNTKQVEDFFKFIKFLTKEYADASYIRNCGKYIASSYIEDFTKYANYVVKASFVGIEIQPLYGFFGNRLIDFLSMYSDYSCMVKDEDLRDLYPENLKAAHDAAVDRSIIVVGDCKYNIAAFKKAAKSYEDLAWENDDVTIVVPKEPNDLVNESAALHNCVRTYIGGVIDHSSKIVFMRKEGNPYMTIEICDNKIVQAKKNCNNLPEDDDVKLLRKYADEKNLVIMKF